MFSWCFGGHERKDDATTLTTTTSRRRMKRGGGRPKARGFSVDDETRDFDCVEVDLYHEDCTRGIGILGKKRKTKREDDDDDEDE